MARKELRILCLHGKGGTSERFAARTAFLKDLSLPIPVVTSCPAAPHAYDEGG